MSDSEYSVIKSDVIKSFDCTSTLLCWERVGKPILSPPPPSIMLGSFNLLFSLSVYVTL